MRKLYATCFKNAGSIFLFCVQSLTAASIVIISFIAGCFVVYVMQRIAVSILG
jgi:hypothetical protein